MYDPHFSHDFSVFKNRYSNNDLSQNDYLFIITLLRILLFCFRFLVTIVVIVSIATVSDITPDIYGILIDLIFF